MAGSKRFSGRCPLTRQRFDIMIYSRRSGPTRGGQASGCQPEAEKRVMYHVYIIESIEYKKFYTGFTDDLQSRLRKHNSGSVRSTKAYKPYKIIYTERFEDKSSARKRELFLKSGQGRKWIKENVENWRDGRVVEGGRLESDYTLAGIGGSNPPPSANCNNN